jgi:hypothetical protein
VRSDRWQPIAAIFIADKVPLAVFARKRREIAAGVPAERFIVNNREKRWAWMAPTARQPNVAPAARAFSRQSRQGMGWLVRMS